MENSNFIARGEFYIGFRLVNFFLCSFSVHPSSLSRQLYHTAMNSSTRGQKSILHRAITRGLYCSRAKKSDWGGMVYSCLTYRHTQNTRRSIIHDEPLQCRPQSYHGRHGAPLPAPMRRKISQRAMQQGYVIKTRI